MLRSKRKSRRNFGNAAPHDNEFLSADPFFSTLSKQAEELTKTILAGPPLQRSIEELMSQIAISPDGDQVMQYLPPP
jgi:hypothetical protein